MGAGFAVEDAPREGPFVDDELIPLLSGCSAVIASMDGYTEKVFRSCPELKVISRWGAGVDSIDIKAATRHGIAVTNTPGFLAQSVADMAIGLMICVARRLVYANAISRAGTWTEVEGSAVHGKCLGIVGLGSIGTEVARRAEGFDMRIIASDPAPRQKEAAELGVEIVPLERLLKEADFVTLHAPLNPQTRNMVGEKQLRMMKPTAYLINTARGGLLDQPALLRALRDGWIAGAALDTLAIEPPSKDDPILKEERCIITPHSAFYTTEAVQRVNAQVCANIIDVLSGRMPEFIVNPEVLRPGGQRS